MISGGGSGHWGSTEKPNPANKTEGDQDRHDKKEDVAPPAKPAMKPAAGPEPNSRGTAEKSIKEGASPWKNLNTSHTESLDEKEPDSRSKPLQRTSVGPPASDDFPSLGHGPTRQTTSSSARESRSSYNEGFTDRYPYSSGKTCLAHFPFFIHAFCYSITSTRRDLS